MATFPIGDGRINPNPCADVPEEMQGWYADVGDTINNLTVTVNEAGIVDTYQFKETAAGVAGYWDEKVLGASVFDAGTHQQVLFEIIDNQIFLFTVAGGGSGGGDTYKVKVASGGSEGFLDTKIHADTWEPSDTYNSGMHFQVLAANVADSVRFYGPYAIIKNSAGDSAPGYLVNKLANIGVYSSSTHILASFQDLGSTVRAFVPKADIVTVIESTVETSYSDVIVRVTGTITARSGTTPGSGSATLINDPTDYSDVGDAVTVYNPQSHPYVGGDGVDGNPPNLYLTASYIGGVLVLNTHDLKSVSGWDGNNNQSIGKNASGEPLWQDDDTTCPEA